MAATTMTKTNKTITVKNITSKRKTGRTLERNEYHADIVKNQSIRIYGRCKTGSTLCPEWTAWWAGLGQEVRMLLVSLLTAYEGGENNDYAIGDFLLDLGAPADLIGEWRAFLDSNVAKYGRHLYRPEWTDFDRTFAIGDEAEHSSYNLSYHDPITGISDKSVTFAGHRLDLCTFIWRNKDFDLAETVRSNREEMMYL